MTCRQTLARRGDRMGTTAARLIAMIGAAIAVASGPSAAQEADDGALGRLKGDVSTLASPEYGGRRGAGARKAEAFVADAFRKAGLAPLFDGRYTQDVMATFDGKPAPIGRNVGAALPGSDPKLRDQWIIVAAHYDHLGTHQGEVHPGADDNASGIAMLLEVARRFAESPEKPGRSIMFVAFDLEEDGLIGSKYFVDHPPVPLDKIALNLTADMIGRSLGGVCDTYFFVLGSESAPGLRPWIELALPGEPWKAGVLGADFLVLPRSDYGPFKARKVPFLFFSTGENPHYHAPTDVAETIDYPKLLAITGMVYKIARKAADADAVPPWTDTTEHAPGEAVTLQDVLRILLERREHLKLKPTQVGMIESTLKMVDESVPRGGFTPSNVPDAAGGPDHPHDDLLIRPARINPVAVVDLGGRAFHRPQPVGVDELIEPPHVFALHGSGLRQDQGIFGRGAGFLVVDLVQGMGEGGQVIHADPLEPEELELGAFGDLLVADADLAELVLEHPRFAHPLHHVVEVLLRGLRGPLGGVEVIGEEGGEIGPPHLPFQFLRECGGPGSEHDLIDDRMGRGGQAGDQADTDPGPRQAEPGELVRVAADLANRQHAEEDGPEGDDQEPEASKAEDRQQPEDEAGHGPRADGPVSRDLVLDDRKPVADLSGIRLRVGDHGRDSWESRTPTARRDADRG
ncbi:MAG: M28 family peptidase [Isosphaeraceae bacterium]